MLDIVLVAVVLIATAVTLLYAGGCDSLLRTDATRDGDEPGRR